LRGVATRKNLPMSPKIYSLLFFNELYLSVIEIVSLGAGFGSAEFYSTSLITSVIKASTILKLIQFA
jgi:hypothetical protein